MTQATVSSPISSATARCPWAFWCCRGGTHAFVANTNADIVTVLDLRSMSISGRLKAGKQPDGLGYTPVTLKQ